MAESVSTIDNPRFHTFFFSDSEIDAAIQLIHLSEDDFTASSDDKSVSVSSAAGFDADGSHTSRSRAATSALIEEIFEQIGVGANRRRRKRRSRSVYEIYKLTKPMICGGGIAKRKWNRRNRRRHESEAVTFGLRDLQIDEEACNLRRNNREAEMEYVRRIGRNRRRNESEAVAFGLRDYKSTKPIISGGTIAKRKWNMCTDL